MASGEPEMGPAPDPMEEPAEAEDSASRDQRVWLLGGGLVVIAAVVIGSAIGAWLGTRQGGPLSTQGTADGRPTIVVGSAVAVKPSVAPSPSAVLAQVAPTAAGGGEVAPATEYVVQPGDTLRAIAEREYGDATAWPRIYQANRDVIGPDPDALQAGTRLQLPP